MKIDDIHPHTGLEKVRDLLVLALQEIEYLIARDLQLEEERREEQLRNNGFYYGENCENCPYSPSDPPEEER